MSLDYIVNSQRFWVSRGTLKWHVLSGKRLIRTVINATAQHPKMTQAPEAMWDPLLQVSERGRRSMVGYGYTFVVKFLRFLGVGEGREVWIFI